MSRGILQIWRHPKHLPVPQSYEDVQSVLARIRPTSFSNAVLHLVNRKYPLPFVRPDPLFTALAKALLQVWPSREMFANNDRDRNCVVWDESPLVQARNAARVAVWHFQLPYAERNAIKFKLLDAASALGLYVFDAEDEIAWLPTGQIVPVAKAAPWTADMETIKAALPKRSTIESNRIVRAKLTKLLEPYKFEPCLDPRFSEWNFAFTRLVQDGEQFIWGGVTPYDLKDDMHSLDIHCSFTDERAAAVVQELFGPGFEHLGEFHLDPFNDMGFWINLHRNMSLDSDVNLQQLFDEFEQGAMLALQLARTTRGRDRLLNTPNALPGPQYNPHRVSTKDAVFRYIVAWLVGNPRIEKQVNWHRINFKALSKPDGLVKASDFEQMVQCLRTEVDRYESKLARLR